MSFADARMYNSVRPQGLQKKGTTGKPAKENFVPSKEQITCATKRIVGVIKKHHGAFPCVAARTRIYKELVGQVFSRGGTLGSNPDEIAVTVRHALDHLLEEGTVLLEENGGQDFLILKELSPGKVHKDKYYQNRTSRRGRSQAAA